MTAYYNEIDKNAAEWLKQLIKMELIADGEVDERSIVDVSPSDLKGFNQCHFFAGIGVWSYALRQAGWEDERQVWTGSCPCQPFSSAGKRKGTKDERHLWPEFYRLIRECKPITVFGEQVANKAGESWFDIVRNDLEKENYAAGLTVFPACSVGAPHQRKRLYWAANSIDNMGNSSSKRLEEQVLQQGHSFEQLQEGLLSNNGSVQNIGQSKQNATNGFWRDADWLYCRDQRWRAVEPNTFPLVDESSSEMVSCSDLCISDIESTKEARTMRLKGYGNTIVAEQAKIFIEAYMEIESEHI